jgi:hypothetical protein
MVRVRVSNKVRRAIAALVLLAFFTSAANHYFTLHLFGRFDRAVLGLCFVLMLIVVHFLRPETTRRPTFSWLQFSLLAAVFIGAFGWIAWRDYESGTWDFGGGAFLLVPVTLLIFLAHRWRLLRKELSDGTFSDERYQASPGTYMMGPVRQQVLWMGVAFAAVVALISIHVLRSH